MLCFLEHFAYFIYKLSKVCIVSQVCVALVQWIRECSALTIEVPHYVRTDLESQWYIVH